jgi:hypothetical protein
MIVVVCLAGVLVLLAGRHATAGGGAPATTAAAPPPPPLSSRSRRRPCSRGVPPADVARYCAPTFTCDEGSTVLPASRVNDDFCDCADGSDESGTAACAGVVEGQVWFVCDEGADAAGAKTPSTRIPTSFVDDGVRDCPGGEDEWGTEER